MAEEHRDQQEGDEEYKTFLVDVKWWLIVSGVPEHLWPNIYRKVTQEIFDASECFTHVRLDGEAAPVVAATRDIEKDSDIWLCDHAWVYSQELAEGVAVGMY